MTLVKVLWRWQVPCRPPGMLPKSTLQVTCTSNRGSTSRAALGQPFPWPPLMGFEGDNVACSCGLGV